MIPFTCYTPALALWILHEACTRSIAYSLHLCLIILVSQVMHFRELSMYVCVLTRKWTPRMNQILRKIREDFTGQITKYFKETDTIIMVS